LILLDQIRTVDKTRLVKRAGAVSDTALSNALSTLQEIFVE
jgi:mRNA interferase MazF